MFTCINAHVHAMSLTINSRCMVGRVTFSMARTPPNSRTESITLPLSRPLMFSYRQGSRLGGVHMRRMCTCNTCVAHAARLEACNQPGSHEECHHHVVLCVAS